MKRFLALIALVLAVPSAGGCAKSETEVAIARIEAAGGSFSRDDQGRVVSVNLSDSLAGDAELGAIRVLPHVEKINCTNARRITGSTLYQLGPLGNLRELYLVGTQLDDSGLSQVRALPGLTTLNLHGTRITDAGMPALDSLNNLQTLVLGRTAITDRGLVQLRNLRLLSTLVLRDTKTTADGVKGLRQMLPDVRVVQ